MPTIDCRRSGSTGELTVIYTGSTNAPVAIDLETGASVTLHPAWAHTELVRFGIGSVASSPHARAGNAWWGDLAVGKGPSTCR